MTALAEAVQAVGLDNAPRVLVAAEQAANANAPAAAPSPIIKAQAPPSEGEPLTYNEQLRLAEYNNAYRELKAIDPTTPALGPFLQTPNWVPSEADVATIRAALAAAKSRSANPGNAVSPSGGDVTPRDGTMGGVPTGTPASTPRGDADTQRGLVRQNETAKALVAAGYRVEQHPSWQPGDTFKPTKSPDLRVGGNFVREHLFSGSFRPAKLIIGLPPAAPARASGGR